MTKKNPIHWAFTVFTLEFYLLALVRTNMEKCDMKFVTPIFSPQYLWNNTVETVKVLRNEWPLFKPEASGYQNSKDHYHNFS